MASSHKALVTSRFCVNQASRTHGSNDDSALCWIIAEGARARVLVSQLADRDYAGVASGDEIMRTYVLITDIEEGITMQAEGGPFAVELEDDETGVVTWSSQSCK